MQRFHQYLCDTADFDQAPGVHHADAVGALGHQPHVVTDQHHGRAEIGLDLAQGFHDLLLHHHVECAGWLVGDNDFGLQCDANGQAHALLHAAAEFVRVAAGYARIEIDQFEQGRHPVV